MKSMGKAKLKITADGLLKIALRLAFVIASIAETWLYFVVIKMGCGGKSILLFDYITDENQYFLREKLGEKYKKEKKKFLKLEQMT